MDRTEVDRLFRRFQGYVVTDPECGEDFTTVRDLRSLAADYFDGLSEQAERGQAFTAWDAFDPIDPDAKGAWYRRALHEVSAPPRIIVEPRMPGPRVDDIPVRLPKDDQFDPRRWPKNHPQKPLYIAAYSQDGSGLSESASSRRAKRRRR